MVLFDDHGIAENYWTIHYSELGIIMMGGSTTTLDY